MARIVHVSITRDDGSTVVVVVHETQKQGPGAVVESRDVAPEPWKPPIDAAAVINESTLTAYFRRVTRAEAPKESVRALALPLQLDRMLDLLGVQGPPPNPVTWDLRQHKGS